MPIDTMLLSLTLTKEGGASAELLDDMTRQLREELLEFGVDSVELPSAASTERGAKSGVDPVIGSLIVGVSVAAAPKLLEVLQSWLTRERGRIMKIKRTKADGDTIEVEFPADMSSEELKERISSVTGE